MPQLCARVQTTTECDFDRRVSDRQASDLEALTRSLETNDVISWGATVRDISSSGIGLTLCYPFRAGTYLAVDIHDGGGRSRTLLTRVVHAVDQPDGTWHVGCEFIKPLSDSDLELMV